MYLIISLNIKKNISVNLGHTLNEHEKIFKNQNGFLKYMYLIVCSYFTSVQFSHLVMSSSLQPHGLQHSRFPYPSLTSGVYANSCPLRQWCYLTLSSSVTPFSSCLQSFPASGSFQMSQFFASGGQSIGVSTSTSVLPINMQNWFPLGWSGWISLQSKGLSRVFSNTTVQKHQFFGAQLYGPTLTSIHDNWKNHSFNEMDLCWQSNVSAF